MPMIAPRLFQECKWVNRLPVPENRKMEMRSGTVSSGSQLPDLFPLLDFLSSGNNVPAEVPVEGLVPGMAKDDVVSVVVVETDVLHRPGHGRHDGSPWFVDDIHPVMEPFHSRERIRTQTEGGADLPAHGIDEKIAQYPVQIVRGHVDARKEEHLSNRDRGAGKAVPIGNGVQSEPVRQRDLL